VTKDFLKCMCCCRSVAMIKHCIRIGLIDVNKIYRHTSPLIMVTGCAVHRRVSEIATLISAGADINKAAGDGATALFIASKWNCRKTMNYLLDQGADTDTDNWPAFRNDAAKRNVQAVIASRSAAGLGASKSLKSKTKSIKSAKSKSKSKSRKE
jgi:ankyrin repeat protein